MVFLVAAPSAVGCKTSRRRERDGGNLGDIHTGEFHRGRLATQSFAVTERTLGTYQVFRDPLAGQSALGFCEGVQQVRLHARKCALVAGRFLALERLARFRWRETGIDWNRRLVIGEENPVAILLRKVAPWTIDIIAEGYQNISLILPSPGGRPSCYRSLPDGERRVGDHRVFGGVIEAAEAVTLRACPFGAVCRKGFPV
jgi:hypothetical protein